MFRVLNFPNRTWNGVDFMVPFSYSTAIISMHPDRVAFLKSKRFLEKLNRDCMIY